MFFQGKKKKKICEVFNEKHEFHRGSLCTAPDPGAMASISLGISFGDPLCFWRLWSCGVILDLKSRRAPVFLCMVHVPGQLSSCMLLAKAEVGDVWLGDSGDNVCPERERVVLRGLKALHGNLLFLKCLHAKDGENCWCRKAEHLCWASVSQPHSFQARRAAGEVSALQTSRCLPNFSERSCED